ncbi:hypothetical protein AOZ06_16045 [Kibdelosporangium phytohabitans]|uniref:Uncharacterized protein n=1 Tax=Kibdelosporangium phytohabitans TaxID=860235 RepID=A0A0N9HXX9_9PSEU|nr:hypothetical protein AOZ06_16045 [Kibdelosporangium phytohabitans]
MFLLSALILALAACGKQDPQPGQESETQQLLVKYAQCMRDNGVPMADPVAGKPGAPNEGVDQDSPAFVSANGVCSPILQGIVADRKANSGNQSANHDKMLALAKCLREHGVDVADPVPGMEKPFGKSLDRTDPAVAAALDKCVTPPGTK